jgi:hypothetical protein
MKIEGSCGLHEVFSSLRYAQKRVKDVIRSGKNPYFGNKYATLDDILSMCRPILSDSDLVTTVLPSSDDKGNLGFIFIIAHTKGQYIETSISLPAPGNQSQESKRDGTGLQELGSMLAYLRKHFLCSVLQIDGGEDIGLLSNEGRSE